MSLPVVDDRRIWNRTATGWRIVIARRLMLRWSRLADGFSFALHWMLDQ